MGIFQTSVTCCCPVKQKHTVINEEALINSISNNNSISKKNKENQTVRDIEIKVGKSMIKKTTNPEEIEEILSHIDIDNNGYIEIEEFISASVDINVLLSETNIKLAFETIDSDNSGLVSLDEVGKFIGGENYDEVLIEKVIKEAGKDPKAEITFEDFKDIINVLKKEEKED